METLATEIKPGTGFGNILFGMTRDQVKKILGEPEETERNVHDDDEEDVTESWHYDEIEVSLSFEKTEDWKLCTIAVSDPNATIKGKKPIGMSKKDAESLLKSLDVKNPRLEDWSTAEDPDYFSLTAEELEMVFWIEEDEVMDIQWGPYFIDEDTIRWPINGLKVV